MKKTMRSPVPRPATGGFTLIELMVVVAVIGILASIALPSYHEQIRRSYRAQAQSCMTQTAHAMERRYTTNLSYGTTDPALACRTEGKLNTRYTISVNNITARTYTVTATAIGAQTKDICGNMTLNHLGAKTPTSNKCW